MASPTHLSVITPINATQIYATLALLLRQIKAVGVRGRAFGEVLRLRRVHDWGQ